MNFFPINLEIILAERQKYREILPPIDFIEVQEFLLTFLKRGSILRVNRVQRLFSLPVRPNNFLQQIPALP
jgi:hypothetical protein